MVIDIVFAVVILIMLVLDLGVFNKKSHAISNREAVIWSIVWISLAMAFSGLIYFQDGFERFSQFQSAYWIEKALSVDNLFVFILVFGFFKVKKEHQHKVLFWGILGALIFRAIFIFSGVKLINLTYLPEFQWIGYSLKVNILLTVFGVFLIYAGIKSLFNNDDEDEEKDFSKSPGAKIIKAIFPRVTDKYHGDKFFIKKKLAGKLVDYATPLLVVVGVIEFTDLIFAVDSIPAIFAIAPNDPEILYTSNIFAILGLRSLYFLLNNFIYLFKFLPYGLGVILTFIGAKMVISPIFHISSPISLGIVVGVLVVSVILSIIFKDKNNVN